MVAICSNQIRADRPRLLFVIYGGGFGGVETATERLCSWLGRHVEVRVLQVTCSSEEQNPQNPGPWHFTPDRLRIAHYHLRPKDSLRHLADAHKVRSYIRAYSPTVVVGVKTPIISFIPFLFPSRKFLLLGIEHRRPGDLREGTRLRDHYVRTQHRSALRRLDRLVVLNSACAKEARGLGVSRTAVIPNPVPDELFDVPLERRRSRKILYLGRFSPEKRLDGLIADWLSVPAKQRESWILSLVGDGPELGRIRGLAEPGLESGAIEILRHTDRPEMVLRDAAALVLPSEYELQPLVLLEALAVGLPVLASQGAVAGFKDYRWSAAVRVVDDGEWTREIGVLLADGAAPSYGALDVGRSAVLQHRMSVVGARWLSLINRGRPSFE